MSIMHRTRLVARWLGIEVTRYNPSQSAAACLGVQLARNNIDCVVDVGAHDGGFGRLVRAAGFNRDLVSFEPQVSAHNRLVAISRKDATWYIAPRMALGDVDTTTEINIAGNGVSSSLLPMMPTHQSAAPASRYVGRESVLVKRLDSVDLVPLAKARRMFLKIDTQGYELPVLVGASAIMDRIAGVQVELSVVPLYQGQVLYQELIQWLSQAGFDLWGVAPGFLDVASGRMLQFDAVFFRAP